LYDFDHFVSYIYIYLRLQLVLRVDNATASDVSRDDDGARDDVTRGGGSDWRHSVHFDVGDQLYVGGLPSSARAPHLDRHVRSRTGFVGCLAAVDLDGDDRALLEQGAELPRQFRDQIVEGCEGLSETSLLLTWLPIVYTATRHTVNSPLAALKKITSNIKLFKQNKSPRAKLISDYQTHHLRGTQPNPSRATRYGQRFTKICAVTS